MSHYQYKIPLGGWEGSNRETEGYRVIEDKKGVEGNRGVEE